ncbi:Flp family type IVb pilin [Pseudomonas sp. 10S4]|jgi:pilus assembly protein Flp/PilA|nr:MULTISPECIES: Flp family type IVb pilin [unclassified Pseudomonas]MBK5551732.1 Flp family type IVb pilin [Pseudomonas sp. TH03]MEB0227302.1 Flp family type IVb pilin [Pseudomonas sp. 5S1]MEB0295935.1 Flp family type IVb pilin [Pseudomonas sp. 10S4]WPX21449.1 Flp family type IVb pilin [Pseudomonas sp. 10S4]
MIFDYLVARAQLFFNSEDGASAIEYAIVVAMVAVVVVAFVTPLGNRVLQYFNDILVGLGGVAQVRTAP